jgi:ABC-type branched-subunit amino acid transport system ATPase component
MSRTIRTVQQIQDICPRFRVLVIGRRNAGKTTILKKMSGSDGNDVEIRDPEGNKVTSSPIRLTTLVLIIACGWILPSWSQRARWYLHLTLKTASH